MMKSETGSWAKNKDIIDTNSFLFDLVVLEAKVMLEDLKANYLHVILLDAPIQNHQGQKIRVADNRNPKWYRDLYSNYPSLKRNHTLASLKRIAERKLNLESIYDKMLLSLIENRLHLGSENFSLKELG